MRFLQSNRVALSSLIVLWLLARLYAAWTTEPFASVEIQQAKKLLEYGFKARHGANLWSMECTGLLPNPEAFNYTHHPYPFFWLLTGLFNFVGPYGVLAVTTLMKLAGYILVFKTFDARFGRFAAWLSTVFYGLAPCGVLEDLSYCCVTQGALLWPVGAWFLAGRKKDDGTLLQPPPWACATLVFVAGQIDWLTLSIVPGLVFLVHDWQNSWRANLRTLIGNPRVRALVLGGTASALVFLIQVLIYHPDIRNLSDWLAVKSGSSANPVHKTHMFALIAVRLLAFVGPALVLGALIGGVSRTNRCDPLVRSCLIFLLGFALLVALIPNYFYMERTVFVTLLFPFTALTAAALWRCGKSITLTLGACCLFGVFYAHLYLSVPAYSPVAKQLGAFIAQHSRANEIVLTNLKPLHPPFKSSDVSGGKATANISDRRIYFGIDNLERFADLPRLLKRNQASLAFFKVESLPIESDLLLMLDRESEKSEAASVAIPASTPTLAECLRSWVWHKVMRKSPQSVIQTPTAGSFKIQIYHLELPSSPIRPTTSRFERERFARPTGNSDGASGLS